MVFCIKGVLARETTQIPMLPQLDINWKSFVPKYTKLPDKMQAEEASVIVPQDYFGDYAPPEATLQLRIRRYCRGAGKQHLIIVPGGPGGHSNAVEAQLKKYLDMLPTDVWVYTIDHRGTGKSSKLIRSKRAWDFATLLPSIVSSLPHPIQIMSSHNASMDIVAIVSSLRNTLPNTHWYLLGESYGAYIANFAQRAAPDIFDGVLLDGFATKLHIGEREGDVRHVIADVCKKNDECKQLIDPDRISRLPQEVVQASNACIDMIVQKVKPPGVEHPNKAHWIRQFNRNVLYAFPADTGQASLVAYLQGAVECKDPTTFERALKVFDRFDPASRTPSTLQSSQVGQKDNPGNASTGLKRYREQRSPPLLNLIHHSERKLTTARCSPQSSQMLSFCEMFEDPHLSDIFAPYLYEPKLPAAYTSRMKQVIVIASKGDSQTLYEDSLEEYNKMRVVQSRSLHSFDYGAHVHMGNTGCDRHIMSQLMSRTAIDLKDARDAAEKCIKEENRRHRSWYYIDEHIRALWGKVPNGAKPTEPRSAKYGFNGAAKIHARFIYIGLFLVGYLAF